MVAAMTTAATVQFTKADCETFAGKLTSQNFATLPQATKDALDSIRQRLLTIAKDAATRHATALLLKPFASMKNPSGRGPRNLWCCVYPAEVPNKSFGLQLALILSTEGAEFCFCMGAGESQSAEEDIESLKALAKCRKALAAVPASTVAAVDASLNGRWHRLKAFMQPPTQGQDFVTLAEWIDHASRKEGARASSSQFLKPEELEAVGPGVVDRFEEMVLLFWPLLAAVYKTTGSAPKQREPTLSVIVEHAAVALSKCGLSFGAQHLARVRTFLVSLATRRFVILAGLSGSGKTQLAMQVGRWFGAEHYRVVPVRPDWTGSEALLGYPDALLPAKKDRRAWAVPGVLQFILKAAADPMNPYLLVLDEMNLAHVERYFAEVLSGMESGEPCVPNLCVDDDGLWRVPEGADETRVFPRNLFLVGTVNVDETTYLFSPKVLDRANTIEFRVAAEELVPGASKPSQCASGDNEEVRGFLALAAADDWHVTHAAPHQPEFVERLRQLHRLLAVGGYEFGHRVFHEATRFSALLAAAGEQGLDAALDLVVLQKVVPRMHGARRKLEPSLCTLAGFAFDPAATTNGPAFDPLAPPAGTPRLPLAFAKLVRMTRVLRDQQFVSFAE